MINEQQLFASADIWSWGVIVYKAISGQFPFASNEAEPQLRKIEVFEKIKIGKYPPLDEVSPSCPRWICEVVTKCLKVDPNQRYRSAQRLLDDIHDRELDSNASSPPFLSWTTTAAGNVTKTADQLTIADLHYSEQWLGYFQYDDTRDKVVEFCNAESFSLV